MTRWICLFLLLTLAFPAVASAEATAGVPVLSQNNQALQFDVSNMPDEQLLALNTILQNELVRRQIEKTATLKAGRYTGGVDLPAGYYILEPAGVNADYDRILLETAPDATGKTSVKFYEYYHGDEEVAVFLRIEPNDTLSISFPCKMTISRGVVFE